MFKLKIISIIVSVLILSVSLTSMTGALTLTNGIDVEVNQWIGIVTPEIDIDNQSVVISASIAENDTYIVNDTLEINVNILDNTNRSNFLLPRAMFYSVFVVREAEITWGFDLISRMLPVRAFGSVNVVNSTIANKTDQISIPFQYTISNTTYYAGENLTMHIMVMGLLPGDTTGIFGTLPIIDYRRLSLNATYI